jgi:hypothetical protein
MRRGIGRPPGSDPRQGYGQVTDILTHWRADALPAHLPRALVDWRDAVVKSQAAQTLAAHRQQMQRQGHISFTTADGGESKTRISTNWLSYALRTNELWARSYAQYIAVRSGDAAMMAELRKEQAEQRAAAVPITAQWQDDDFEPIARAFDAIFTQLGWLH